MAHSVPEIIICLLVFGCIGTIYVISRTIHAVVGSPVAPLSEIINQQPPEYAWIFRLGLNCLGYASIFISFYIIHKYVSKTKYMERSGSGCFPNVIRLCLSHDIEKAPTDNLSVAPVSSTSCHKDTMLLSVCLLGLMGSYLVWGLLQEKIMTKEYVNGVGTKVKFTDSQFLVFVNRFLAVIVAGAYITFTPRRQPKHVAPLYKYSFCSFSNIMSAWFQYEALKYVSFPTQVLAKSCKILPVMAMGKIISRVKHEHYEYVTALLISLGMVMFLFGSSGDNHASTVTTLSGVILLVGYMTFDSFTSNWQGELFKTYKMSPVQMMCGVNLFSCLFTATSIAQQGGFVESLQFMTEFPTFTTDCIMLSLCSVSGQLFVYFTIATFGPVVFTIIMTLRQAIAILLSCLVFGHQISILGVLGIMMVFFAVMLRIYCNQRLKAIRQRAENANAVYRSRTAV